jgi:hypothetical protein
MSGYEATPAAVGSVQKNGDGRDHYVLYIHKDPDLEDVAVFGPACAQECGDFYRNMLDSSLAYKVVHKSAYKPVRVEAPPAKPFPSESEWVPDPEKHTTGKHRVSRGSDMHVKREKK